jgi:hypothetical protein
MSTTTSFEAYFIILNILKIIFKIKSFSTFFQQIYVQDMSQKAFAGYSLEMFKKNKTDKNVKIGDLFYNPIKKCVVSKNQKNELMTNGDVRQEHAAAYKNLEIFQTQFGITLLEFLLNECPDLCLLDHNIGLGEHVCSDTCKYCGSNIKTEKPNQIYYKNKKMIASGSIQSGKSLFIMAFALLNVLLGKSSVILFRNMTADLIQFEDRIRGLVAKFQDFAKSRKIVLNNSTINITTSTDSGEIRNTLKAKNKENIISPTIYLCIANESGMGKISDQIRGRENFVLIIDEVDFVDSKSLVRSECLNKIKGAADFVLGVTATPLATCVEWNLPATGIVELSRKSNYVGFDNQEDFIQFHEVDTGSKSIKASLDDIQEIYNNTPALAKYIDDFSNCELAVSDEGMHMQEMTLIRLCTGIIPQNTLAQDIITKYPKMGVAVFVQRGCYIYHPSFGTERISVDKECSKVKGNIHEFSPDVDVGAVLSLFQAKGVAVIPRIICIAGVRAARGISFSSCLVPEDPATRLRVNSMFVKISSTTVNSEILQIFGRVLGNFEGVTPEHPQRIYCSPDDCESVQKAFLTLQELLNRTCRKYGEVVQKFVVFANGRCAIVNTWQAIDVDGQFVPTMRTLLQDIEMSDFKCVVYAKTENGKPKKITRKITSRKAVVPQLVEDDGQGNTQADYVLDMTVVSIQSDEEYQSDAEELKESDIKSVEGQCYLIPSNLQGQYKETYDLIVDYLVDNAKTEWVKTSLIETWIQNNGFFNLLRKKIDYSENMKGLIVKKMENRWNIKIKN